MQSDIRRRRTAAWLLALALFALGAAAGIAADRLLRRPPPAGRPGPPAPEEIVERMTRELDLSDAQARAVGEIVHERWRALSTLFERLDPEAEAIRRQADDRIRAVLDPAQRARFDERVAEQARRRAELRARLGGGAATPR